MKPNPHIAWNAARLDVRAFALAGGHLNEETPLTRLNRLLDELCPGDEADRPQSINWQAIGEMRSAPSGGDTSIWLHLTAHIALPLTCQRCLGPVGTSIEVDRWFRFVADESAAVAEDEACEEDLLALEPRPNLLEVLEDELLMALPLVPMHENCPVPVVLQSGDPVADAAQGEEPARKNPFAALARLKKQ